MCTRASRRASSSGTSATSATSAKEATTIAPEMLQLPDTKVVPKNGQPQKTDSFKPPHGLAAHTPDAKYLLKRDSFLMSSFFCAQCDGTFVGAPDQASVHRLDEICGRTMHKTLAINTVLTLLRAVDLKHSGPVIDHLWSLYRVAEFIHDRSQKRNVTTIKEHFCFCEICLKVQPDHHTCTAPTQLTFIRVLLAKILMDHHGTVPFILHPDIAAQMESISTCNLVLSHSARVLVPPDRLTKLWHWFRLKENIPAKPIAFNPAGAAFTAPYLNESEWDYIMPLTIREGLVLNEHREWDKIPFEELALPDFFNIDRLVTTVLSFVENIHVVYQETQDLAKKVHKAKRTWYLMTDHKHSVWSPFPSSLAHIMTITAHKLAEFMCTPHPRRMVDISPFYKVEMQIMILEHLKQNPRLILDATNLNTLCTTIMYTADLSLHQGSDARTFAGPEISPATKKAYLQRVLCTHDETVGLKSNEIK